MATIKDVAKRAGVALSTASLVLNNGTRVSDETRRKVWEAVESLNYRPNAIARNLKRRKSDTVGLFLTGFGGPFFGSIIQGLEDVVASNNYNLVACSTSGNARNSANRFLLEKQFDAAVIFGPNIPDEVLLQVEDDSFPIVLMDRELDGKHLHKVLVNNVQGAHTATSHLIRQGRRTVGFLNGGVNSYNGSKRFDGYRKALEEAGLPYQPSYTAQGHFTEQGGYQATKSLIISRKVPEAIFCANDEMAIGCVQALTEAGYRIPDDVALVGFDDIRLAEFLRPSLTTIRHPMYEWGTIVAHVIFQALQDAWEAPQSILLDTELIQRESCAASTRKRPFSGQTAVSLDGAKYNAEGECL